jgi:hypothetical protein
MWVLIVIMMSGEGVKVSSANQLFSDYSSCLRVSYALEDMLTDSRPTEDSMAYAYCLELPKGV